MSIFGTPSKGNGGFAATSGTVVTCSSVNTQLGDLIVVEFIGSFGGSITSVKDTIGNSYVISSALGGATAGIGYYAYCLSSIAANATNTIKVTFTSTQQTFASAFVWSVPIISGTVAFDTNLATGALAHGTSSTPTTASFNTAGSDEWVGSLVGNDLTGLTYTLGSGYTLDSSGFNSGVCGAEHQIFSGPQTGITASFGSSHADFTILAAGFIGTPTYSISGSSGVAAATVSYSGTASGSVTADGSGNYTISGLSNGSYTITPSLAKYTFSPASQNETVNDADITGVDFTATAISVGASGTGENIINAGYGLSSTGGPTWMQSPKTVIVGTNIGSKVL